MILRRFTKHVTDQNWFAVGLDVIVVVVGIFLGMQVTEWNDDRKDKKKELSYLSRLSYDIDSTKVIWEQHGKIYPNIYKKGLQTISLLDGEEQFESKIHQLATLYVSTQSPGQLYLIDDTYEELASTGQLTLIQNEEIRREFRSLIRWVNKGRPDNIMATDNVVYRNHVRSFIPIELQMAIRNTCGGSKSRTTCILKADVNLINETLQQLIENQLTKPYLIVFMQSVAIEINRISDGLSRMQKLNTLIQQELVNNQG